MTRMEQVKRSASEPHFHNIIKGWGELHIARQFTPSTLPQRRINYEVSKLD